MHDLHDQPIVIQDLACKLCPAYEAAANPSPYFYNSC